MALRVGPVGPSREAGGGCLGGQDWARSAAFLADAADRVRTSPAGGPSAERARLQSMRAPTQAPRSRPRRCSSRLWHWRSAGGLGCSYGPTGRGAARRRGTSPGVHGPPRSLTGPRGCPPRRPLARARRRRARPGLGRVWGRRPSRRRPRPPRRLWRGAAVGRGPPPGARHYSGWHPSDQLRTGTD